MDISWKIEKATEHVTHKQCQNNFQLRWILTFCPLTIWVEIYIPKLHYEFWASDVESALPWIVNKVIEAVCILGVCFILPSDDKAS